MIEVNSFKNESRSYFYEYARLKPGSEHELVFTRVFNEYQDLLDRHFSRFARSHGVTVEKLYLDCSDALDNKFTPLFEENENKWFVDLIMCWVDYNHFVDGMIHDVRSIPSFVRESRK